MCWSFEVSLITTFIVWVSVLIMIIRRARNDLWNALFLAVFGSMQAVDAAFWKLDLSECSSLNSFISHIAAIIILAEPFAALFGPLASYGRWPTSTEFSLYCFLVLGCTNLMWVGADDCLLCTFKNGAEHLLYFSHPKGCPGWFSIASFPNISSAIPIELRVIFLLTMIYPYIMYMQPRFMGILQASILMTTWSIGIIFGDAFGSIWCLTNVAQAFTMIADPYVV